MTLRRTALPLFLLVLCLLALVPFSLAQTEAATLSGLITDPQGKVVPDVAVEVTNVDTNVSVHQTTNGVGLYVVVGLKPGRYRISVTKQGFRRIDLTDLVLNVQDVLSRNFQLQVGPVMASITVVADEAKVNTESATVSTVVDRNFAENLPMNGRSFQTLIEVTPGVVVTTSNDMDGGQFSINGQRSYSNYWTVDGVSANIGIGVNAVGSAGNGLGGTLGAFSVMGGTNSLVSVDAMQEFRIQTSTYAPEFGRTPGGQISILTRSGTNQFHGTAFDYLRNDIFDANNWFNGYTNPSPLPKAKERQNDFGGTFGGPLRKDHTFFFFSYEGLRLRLPQTTLSTVPDLSARENAVATMTPYLDAFPQPNGLDNPSTGTAVFNASYSNPASLDAYSLRLDHQVNSNVALFARYNYSPSSLSQRAPSVYSLSTLESTKIATQTATLGLIWSISPTLSNDLRFNWSRASDSASFTVDNFGGATSISSFPFPSQYGPQNSELFIQITPLQQYDLQAGKEGQNVQRQINVVDSIGIQRGSHSLKAGVDFRRLTPVNSPYTYAQLAGFLNVSQAETGSLLYSSVRDNLAPAFLFRNLGLYTQDTWRVARNLTLTYGLRWDVDFPPRSQNGLDFPGVTGFDLANLSLLALAPSGAGAYRTSLGNFAPRVGIAYQLLARQDWQTVVRGGFGVFYDLASSEAGNQVGLYPFGANNTSCCFTGTFPLSPSAATPPSITPSGGIVAFDPNLRDPYTLEWNVAAEQSLGRQQSLSASYIGAAGRRLLQTALVFAPNPAFAEAQFVMNAGMSNYNALQLEFQRHLSRGLQAIASYTWSHSIDTASAGSYYNASDVAVPGAIAGSNRASSDFDIRNALSVGLTYAIPAPSGGQVGAKLLRGWSVENFFVARSAPPVDLSDINFSEFQGGFYGDVRPDTVPGQPLYLHGPEYPGGKAFNPTAFTDPPYDPITGLPTRQGTVPRNFLRGFGAAQWDFAIHRDFPIRESVKLQFRAEMFNLLNHPNFGQPSGLFGSGNFGLSTQMLGTSLNGNNLGGGAFSPLYQIGEPRSMQFALKLNF